MSRRGIDMQRSGQAAGFGLIELMIAMVLGLIVLGAAIAVFQSNQRSYSANEGQNRVQENARAAYEMVTRDIRATGGSACSAESLVLGSDASSNAAAAHAGGNGPSSSSKPATISGCRISFTTMTPGTSHGTRSNGRSATVTPSANSATGAAALCRN